MSEDSTTIERVVREGLTQSQKSCEGRFHYSLKSCEEHGTTSGERRFHDRTKSANVGVELLDIVLVRELFINLPTDISIFKTKQYAGVRVSEVSK